MSIPGAASPLFLATTGAAAAFEISRSLRFNSADTAYLNRTPSSAGNRKTYTLAFWVKKCDISDEGFVFSASSSVGANGRDGVRFENGDNFRVFFNGASSGDLITTALFKDPAAWYHFVVTVDTTQSTASDRVKIYQNGSQITAFNTATYPSQNYQSDICSNVVHRIGSDTRNTSNNLDAYLAEVNFIDGQALAPTDFGETDDNGVWQAIDTAGLTFGTNGFRLKFDDNSSNTALGNDSSGNDNDWSVNNLTAAAAGLATANQGFDVATYTGNGGTQSISSLAFQPDFVWIKCRSIAHSNHVFDSVRGATKHLFTNNTLGEVTSTNFLTSFDSDGFSLGTDNSVNQNSSTFVAWCWKAGGTASSNTDGTITSQVSASTDYGFSIVSWTGNQTDGASVGHGLGSVPKLILAKSRADSTYEWITLHETPGTSSGFSAGNLNTTDSIVDISNGSRKCQSWHAAPTSSVFSLGIDGSSWDGTLNKSEAYIAYVWSEVAGFSKFGSYSGGTNPKTITTGFKPAFLLIKRSDGSNEWVIIDSKRGGTKKLSPSLGVVENDGTYLGGDSANTVEFLSDGFKLTSTNAETNGSGQTHIYAAYASKPSGEGVDSLVDTPTNGDTASDTGAGGEITGNYATLNPLIGTPGELLTYSNGNLECAANASSGNSHRMSSQSTIGVSAGKFYWEYSSMVNSLPGVAIDFGVANSNIPGETMIYNYAGTWYNQGSATAPSNGASWTSSDVIGVALNMDDKELTFYKNGVAQGTFTGLVDKKYFAARYQDSSGSNSSSIFNFGQRAFAYPLSGYKSLNTANLSSTIADGSKYFDTKLWTGNGSTQTISGLNYSPDFIWHKIRSISGGSQLYDSVRGTSKRLRSDSTAAESTLNGVTAFNSDGWTMTAGNNNNESYVSWAWDGGTSTVTNNDGSIATQVRASAASGFSIIKYTGNNTSGATVGHGLNAAPEFAIFRQIAVSNDWSVYSKAAGATGYLRINLTDAFTTTSGQFNNTDPNSSVITLGGDHNVNGPSNEIICYAFAPVEGYSAMGSFEGNGNSSGPFIYTGFKPSWIIIKNIDNYGSGYDWFIFDSKRDTYNTSDAILKANLADSESDSDSVDILSNGFKLRATTNGINLNAHTHVYLAFASNPFQANGGLAR